MPRTASASTTTNTSNQQTPIGSYLKRLLFTGFAFALFATGTSLFAIIAILLKVAVANPRRRQLLLQRILSRLLNLFWQTIEAGGLISISVKGLEHVNRNNRYILVANHPTLIDALLLLALFPQSVCLVKGELLKRWHYRNIIAGLGYLPIAPEVDTVKECVNAVEMGNSLIVFPEGTRSATEVKGFSRGAAVIAIRSNTEVLPIFLSSSPPSLQRGDHWFNIPNRPIDFNILIHYPISPNTDARPGQNEREVSVNFTTKLEEMFVKSFAQQYTDDQFQPQPESQQLRA